MDQEVVEEAAEEETGEDIEDAMDEVGELAVAVGLRERERGRHHEPTASAGCCIARDRANLTGLVLGCIEAKFCK